MVKMSVESRSVRSKYCNCSLRMHPKRRTINAVTVLKQARPFTSRTFRQVAYTGLLQMFLTPRSVCVLVCNATLFENSSNRNGGQLDEDCRKLQQLCVCDWLRSISRRVPDNDVLLVATKCDLVAINPRGIGRRVEEACRTWLARWVHAGMRPAMGEDGVCLTTCCASGTDGQEERSGGHHAVEGGWACDRRDSTDENKSPSLLHQLVSSLKVRFRCVNKSCRFFQYVYIGLIVLVHRSERAQRVKISHFESHEFSQPVLRAPNKSNRAPLLSSRPLCRCPCHLHYCSQFVAKRRGPKLCTRIYAANQCGA